MALLNSNHPSPLNHSLSTQQLPVPLTVAFMSDHVHVISSCVYTFTQPYYSAVKYARQEASANSRLSSFH